MTLYLDGSNVANEMKLEVFLENVNFNASYKTFAAKKNKINNSCNLLKNIHPNYPPHTHTRPPRQAKVRQRKPFSILRQIFTRQGSKTFCKDKKSPGQISTL